MEVVLETKTDLTAQTPAWTSVCQEEVINILLLSKQHSRKCKKSQKAEFLPLTLPLCVVTPELACSDHSKGFYSK